MPGSSRTQKKLALGSTHAQWLGHNTHRWYSSLPLDTFRFLLFAPTYLNNLSHLSISYDSPASNSSALRALMLAWDSDANNTNIKAVIMLVHERRLAFPDERSRSNPVLTCPLPTLSSFLYHASNKKGKGEPWTAIADSKIESLIMLFHPHFLSR